LRTRLWLAALAVLLAAPGCKEPTPPPPQAAATPAAPLVVLISVDALRADRLNCYGYAERKVSPHLDALARDGLLFSNHITASPWTTPAHMSMLTSLSPSAHGVLASFSARGAALRKGGMFVRLPDGRTTLAEVLSRAGYATAAFTAGGTMDPKIGFGQGFASYDTSMIKLGERNMARMHEWIAEHREKRKFLFWHHFEVHAPYLDARFLELGQGGERRRAAIREELARMARRLRQERSPDGVMPRFHGEFKAALEEHHAFERDVCEALYCGGVASADGWFGRFVQELREQGLYESALILVTSDHGEEFGERDPDHFYDRHGHSLYEELVRVPLIIKLPQSERAGTRVSAVTRAIDLMPTILDLLGVTPASHEMEGSSLRELWERSGSAAGRRAFSEALAFGEEQKGVRSASHKLLFRFAMSAEAFARRERAGLPEDAAPFALFDLEADPGERRNLAASAPAGQPKSRRIAGDLERSLREHHGLAGGLVEPVRLDPQTVERLKSLGYVE